MSIKSRLAKVEIAARNAKPERWRVVRQADLDSGAVVLEGRTYRDTQTGEVLRRVIRIVRGSNNEHENTTEAH